jgi:hypothetical protein
MDDLVPFTKANSHAVGQVWRWRNSNGIPRHAPAQLGYRATEVAAVISLCGNGQHAVVAEHYSTTTPRAKAELPSIQHSGSRGD